MVQLLPSALRLLLSSLLWSPDPEPTLIQSSALQFQLRHQHALTNTSTAVFADVPPSFIQETYRVSSRRLTSHRPYSQAAFQNARQRSIESVRMRALGQGNQTGMRTERMLWEDIEVLGPEVGERETVLTLAKMTNNAYMQPSDAQWYDLSSDWNASYPFGWEPDEDGFRGHVFVSTDNSTVVVSIKGTSASWIVGGGGPTTRKDKLNDNLLFSCCCARVGPTWWPVCDCYSGGYKCDLNCLEKSLVEDSLFYPVGINLYNNVSYMYPDATIWMTGHSLGGALASLVGSTFGAPVVAFEAPGEKMAARRLHLPSPPSTQHITHVYHTADPIAMGTCNGVSSTCAIAGYAMESRCHLGKVIKYDTVSKLNWGVDVRTHPIRVVIERLLAEDWEPAPKDGKEGDERGKGKQVPEPIEEEDCVDCFNWEYGEFKNVPSLGGCGW
ncbi:hypothetical protein JAAARDRAFT_42266 [Jaapia argillacea MUCL 33604]|uniref:triacylglycerol lipase n=1 Tax=Jaapia argillacea MUCL 33604 TaxID=933084 RepID=A0A067P649_9AGAM|nr:hypothetical protein JAAARDRAFT_42266 [Jaapia argillacea MUCL 33604]